MSDFYPVSLNVENRSLNNQVINNHCNENKNESIVVNANKDIVIKIRDHETANNTFIRYCIEVYIKCEQHFWLDKTGEKSWNVLRRYSDFDSLRNMLIKRYPACLIPPLPCKVNSKIPWRVANQMNDTDFIDSRRQRLEWFLTRLISHPKLGREMLLLEFLKCGDNWSDIQTTIDKRLSAVVNWRWINVQSRLIQIFDTSNSTSQLNEMLKSKSLSDESLQLVDRGRALQDSIQDLLNCLSKIEEQTVAMHRLYKNYGEVFYDWCGNEKEAGDALQSFSHLCDNFSNIMESPSANNRVVVRSGSVAIGDTVCNGLSWHEISLLLQELYDYGETWIELAGRMAIMQRKINRLSDSVDDLNNQLERLKNGQSPKSGALAQLKNKFTKSPTTSELSILIQSTETTIYDCTKSLIALKADKELFEKCVEEEIQHFSALRQRDLRLVMQSYACNQLAYSQTCLKLWKRAKQTVE